LTDKSTYDYLRSISPDLKIVKGRFDSDATSLPLSGVVTHGSLRIGFLEGFTVVAPTEADLLLAEANKLDVDVLCWGGTHRFDAYEYGDKFFVNPGSATGAMTTGWVADGEEIVPSFCLMDVSILLNSKGRPPRQWPLESQRSVTAHSLPPSFTSSF
jgi:vacuolar protein sorting-associated protein 29